MYGPEVFNILYVRNLKEAYKKHYRCHNISYSTTYIKGQS